jgi:hypothetical protein
MFPLAQKRLISLILSLSSSSSRFPKADVPFRVNQKSSYHSTSLQCKRKSGSQLSQYPVRAPSKKQKKRRKERIEVLKSKVDHRERALKIKAATALAKNPDNLRQLEEAMKE